MRKIALLILVVLTMVLAACTSDESKGTEQTGDNNETAKATEDNKQEDKNKEEKEKADELPGQYKVFVENTTFEFIDSNEEIKVPFKVAKDGKALTGEKLGIQVVVPIGKIPFQATELGNGKFEGEINVPEPGVYKANVFKMTDNRINVIGTFSLTIE